MSRSRTVKESDKFSGRAEFRPDLHAVHELLFEYRRRAIVVDGSCTTANQSNYGASRTLIFDVAPNLKAMTCISFESFRMRKETESEIQLLRDEGMGPEAVTSFSRDEEVRLLGLADTALNNEQPPDPKLQAGDHAREEHQRLKDEIEATVEQVEKRKDRAA